METPLFNTHDLILALIINECILVALFILMHSKLKLLHYSLIAIFLILNAMIAFHTITLWGQAIRFKAFEFSPNIFYMFSFSIFLQGPVFYWFIKSAIDRNFTLKFADIYHLIPSLLTPFYLYYVYYRYSLNMKHGLALNFEIYKIDYPSFIWFVHMQKSIIVIYGILCAYQVLKCRNQFKCSQPDEETIKITWLVILSSGFLFTWLWILISHVTGIFHYDSISSNMGIVGNYLTCLMINILIFYSLFTLKKNEPKDFITEKTDGDLIKETIKLDNIDRVRQAMEVDKLFLNSRLTLEEFSRRIKLPARQVSTIINHHLNQNFHEFLNKYRIYEAKRILCLPDAEQKNVMDIAIAVGFNSKPAFNRFFKKFTNMTPTEFREQHLSSKSFQPYETN